MANSAPPTKGVTTPPKYRRCTRSRHHLWTCGPNAGIYGRWVRCISCGAEDLAW